jgi:hypothetical protein
MRDDFFVWGVVDIFAAAVRAGLAISADAL